MVAVSVDASSEGYKGSREVEQLYGVKESFLKYGGGCYSMFL